MSPTQEAQTIKTILQSVQSILDMLGDEHPLTETVGDDLEALIDKVDGGFPLDEC